MATDNDGYSFVVTCYPKFYPMPRQPAPHRMVFIPGVFSWMPICICRNCRDRVIWFERGMRPYRWFLRQQRAARKARRGWA